MKIKVKEIIILIMVCLFYMIIIGLLTYSMWKTQQNKYDENVERRKGICVEYKGQISGNYIKNGSDGYTECIAWEDLENKGHYIRYSNGKYIFEEKLRGEDEKDIK